MGNTYTWILNNGCLETAPSSDGLIKVIKKINWCRRATTIVDDKEYYIDIYGEYNCEAPNSNDFTNYEDITLQDIEKWLNDGLDVSELDKTLDSSLSNLMNPPTIFYPNPWSINSNNK